MISLLYLNTVVYGGLFKLSQNDQELAIYLCTINKIDIKYIKADADGLLVLNDELPGRFLGATYSQAVLH